jgi:YHS domain-containing protein
LKALDIAVPCAMSPEKVAIVDADHLVTVNWDVFYFSAMDLKAKFEKAPTLYCGALTDPVTRIRFRPDEESPRVEYGGRHYFFSSDSTASVFRSTPADLANPSYAMASMPATE